MATLQITTIWQSMARTVMNRDLCKVIVLIHKQIWTASLRTADIKICKFVHRYTFIVWWLSSCLFAFSILKNADLGVPKQLLFLCGNLALFCANIIIIWITFGLEQFCPLQRGPWVDIPLDIPPSPPALKLPTKLSRIPDKCELNNIFWPTLSGTVANHLIQ